MNLKNKVISLATVLILGVGTAAIADAAVPVNLRHPMAVMADLIKTDAPLNSDNPQTAGAKEKVTITSVETSAKTEPDRAKADSGQARSEDTAHYVYMGQMAAQMDEHMADTNGMMQNMGSYMNDGKHIEQMQGHMSDADWSAAGRHMRSSDDPNRHMGNPDEHMSGMGSHMGM